MLTRLFVLPMVMMTFEASNRVSALQCSMLSACTAPSGSGNNTSPPSAGREALEVTLLCALQHVAHRGW